MTAQDPRILQALALLRSAFSSRTPSDAIGVGEPWHDSPVPMSVDTDVVSATDMLSLWLPNVAAGQDPWGTYFDGDSANDHGLEAPIAAFRMPAAVATPTPHLSPAPPPATFAEPWPDRAQDQLDDAQAVEAVDRLYEFVHALGKLDADAAIACVAADYHGIDMDREIDRPGLRSQLEALCDRLRGYGEIEASLTEVPSPLWHPIGVLIHCTIQIDASSADGKEKDTTLIERVAVLREFPEAGHLICGLGWVTQP